MNVYELHKSYIDMWPKSIRVDDGYSTGSGFMLPTLSNVHRAVEDAIDHKTDLWGSVFTWSMFQACHSYARSLHDRGIAELVLSEVPLEAIDQRVIKNISGDDWAGARARYSALGSNPSLQADAPLGPTA